MNINLGKYLKTVAAFLAFCGVIGACISDGNISMDDVVAIGSSGAGVIAVYQVRNKKK